jgi:cholesterol transport system auxiliary component
MTLSRRLFLAARLPAIMGGALAGCSAVITGGGDPPRLYTVNAHGGGAGAPPVQWNLEVPVPTAPQGLNSQRIALRRSPVSLEYYAGVNWVDVAPEMVQTALVHSFENSGAITGVARDSTRLRPDYVLVSDLRDFQADYDTANGPPLAHVRIVARLMRLVPDRAIIASQAFEASVRAGGTTVDSVVVAFDQATSQVANQIVDWTLRAPGTTVRLAPAP